MDRYQPTNPFVAKQPDGDYYLVTEVDAEIERLKEQCEKWRLACHEGTEAHKRKLDEIAALKEDVYKWIKIAGENQRSANKSVNWAEDAEVRIIELTKLDKSMCSRLDTANAEIAALKKRIKELEDGLFEITSKMAEHTEDRGPDND